MRSIASKAYGSHLRGGPRSVVNHRRCVWVGNKLAPRKMSIPMRVVSLVKTLYDRCSNVCGVDGSHQFDG